MIRIKTKKEMRSGVKGRRILGVEAILKKDLPEDYLRGKPYCYRFRENPSCDWALFISSGPMSYTIRSGNWYEEEYFAAMMEDVCRAGRRLKEINKEIRRQAQEWGDGEKETFCV